MLILSLGFFSVSHAGTCFWVFKDPKVKELDAVSFEYFDQFKHQGKSFYLLRKPVGKIWDDSSAKIDFQGDPTDVFSYLGKDVAHNTGFRHYLRDASDKYKPEVTREEFLVIPGPLALMKAVSGFSKYQYKKLGRSTSINFEASEGIMGNLEFLRMIANDSKIPFSTKGVEFVHDYNYHYFSFLIPRKLVRFLQHISSSWLRLRERIKRDYNLSDKEIDRMDYQIAQLVDGSFANLSTAIFSQNFTVVNIKENVIDGLSKGTLVIIIDFLRRHEKRWKIPESDVYKMARELKIENWRLTPADAEPLFQEARESQQLFVEFIKESQINLNSGAALENLEKTYGLTSLR